MSLLTGTVDSTANRAFFPMSAVSSQVYTAAYSSPTPYLQAVSAPLQVGTYQVTVGIYCTAATSGSTTSTDVIQFYVYSTNALTYELYLSQVVPSGAYSSTLNANILNYFDITLSGFVTISDPSQFLTISASLLQGTGTYMIRPVNISYALVSRAVGAAGTPAPTSAGSGRPPKPRIV